MLLEQVSTIMSCTQPLHIPVCFHTWTDSHVIAFGNSLYRFTYQDAGFTWKITRIHTSYTESLASFSHTSIYLSIDLSIDLSIYRSIYLSTPTLAAKGGAHAQGKKSNNCWKLPWSFVHLQKAVNSCKKLKNVFFDFPLVGCKFC